MNVFEIVAGVVLILCSLVIIILVLLQESKGNGLSGAIGGDMMMMGDGRSRTTDAIMAKYTKIAAIVFFVLAIAVSVLSVLFK
ncbi:MAG: preprotein translocase subunit SecG [Oscillospiraceae bacterium]|nr:preprotein translocase subunit SecG [Oscillospiraceae bacterium]